MTNRTSPTWALSNWPASPFIAGALAIIIFVIDTFTPLNIAIAVLYVIVVLMAANFLRRRGVILVSLACAGLTVLSFILQHDWDTSDSIGRNLVSLTAIGVTAILALNRQRAEDAWRRSETYLTEAQRLSRTGSFSWKIATEEQVWSEEIFRIFEYDFATKPTLDLVRRRSHPDDALMLEQAFEQALSGAQSIDITNRLLMPDGSVKHVKVLAHPAQDVENNVEYIGVLMDITSAKQAEEALQELHASLAHVTRVTTLGELTASIVHEVNQPLAAIVTNGDAGLLWLNREVPQLDEVRSAVERMIDCAKHASEGIARLRALSGNATAETVRLDINEVVNEVIALIRQEISNHQVSVQLDLASPLPPIFGDRVQLQQVIMNLLINGIQAMAPINDRRRELLIRSRAHNSEQVLVEVRDSGVGIDPEHVGQLFYFHIDIAEVQTEDGKLYMFVAVDRASKFAYAELHPRATRTIAKDFLDNLTKAVPDKIPTVLTDNGIQFTKREGTEAYWVIPFDRLCDALGIAHRLTKINHPWTNGQVERMNRTIKEATVRRYTTSHTTI